MRDAQSLLDQVIVFAGKTIGEAEVRAALGVADRSVLYRVTEAILAPRSGALPQRRRRAAPLRLRGRRGSAATWCGSCGNLTVAALFQRSAPAHRPPGRRGAGDDAPGGAASRRTICSGSSGSRRTAPRRYGSRMLPELVLEMTLVKMATMPDAAPVERSDRAPRGDGAAARARRRWRPRPPDVRRASRARAAARAGRTASAPAPSTARRGRRCRGRRPRARAASAATPRRRRRRATRGVRRPAVGWEALLAAAQAKVSLKVYARRQPAARGERRTCCTSASRTSFANARSASPSSLASLQEIAMRCYGGARRDRGERREAAGARSSRCRMAAEERAPARALRARPSQRERCAPALDILGGEVTDVRPRSRGRERMSLGDHRQPHEAGAAAPGAARPGAGRRRPSHRRGVRRRRHGARWS